jgi:signal transduction histidine kinase
LHERTETLRLNEIFTAALGHDLRNPLSAIVLSAHVLQAHSDAVVRDTAGRMLVNGKRMTRMIEDMLDFARARQGGGFVLKRESVDLGALVARLVPEFQAAFPDRRIEVRQDGDLAGDWDAVRLAQVASNLIGNALQHGDGAEPVELHLEGTHGAVLLAVTNGGDIPADVLPHVFSPFRGRQREPGRDEGLGLGLYIVQQIVHAHAGTIEVQTNVAQHTRFLVRIPRGSGAVAAAALTGARR